LIPHGHPSTSMSQRHIIVSDSNLREFPDGL
jgi:hypothetical protein